MDKVLGLAPGLGIGRALSTTWLSTVREHQLIEEVFLEILSYLLAILDNVGVLTRLAKVDVEKNWHALVLLERHD